MFPDLGSEAMGGCMSEVFAAGGLNPWSVVVMKSFTSSGSRLDEEGADEERDGTAGNCWDVRT